MLIERDSAAAGPAEAAAATEAAEAAALGLKAPLPLPPAPHFAAESALARRGYAAVCGVDEVGRGPLAGPVVVAAVILDPANLPRGLNDSKKLTAAARAALSGEILQKARAVAFASLCAAAIDALNIRAASLEAMRRAVAALAIAADYALVDGRDIPPGLGCPASALIKGDGRSLSVAAASVLAKHRRDAMMRRAGAIYPAYGFGRHAGYGTAAHQAALAAHGPLAGLHRASFAPVRKLLEK